jgi:hypothetical protein
MPAWLGPWQGSSRLSASRASQRYLNSSVQFSEYRIGKEMIRAKHVLSQAEGTQSTPSSEKQENFFSLRSWRLGARKFLEVVRPTFQTEESETIYGS